MSEHKPIPVPHITFGTEMEYCVAPLDLPVYNGVSKNVMRAIAQDTPHLHREGHNQNDLQCANGMRIYPEHGDKVEFASAEDGSFYGLAHAEIAQERILERAGKRMALEYADIKKDARGHYVARTSVPAEHVLKPSVVRKRVADESKGHWGYHINMGISKRAYEAIKNERGAYAYLLAYLSTQAVINGAGNTKVMAGKVVVQPSQKVGCVNTIMSTDSTGNRPLIHLREEHHSSSKHARLHIVSMDPSMNPGVTWLKLGTLAWAYRLGQFDQAADTDAFTPHDPLTACHVTGTNTGLDATFLNSNLESMTALDVQESLLERAETLAASGKYDFSSEELAVLPQWRFVIDLMKAKSPATRFFVEWMARTNFLHRALAKPKWQERAAERRYTLSQQVRILDKTWDSIDPRVNTARPHMQVDGVYPAMPDYDEMLTQEYISVPPANSRAYARGHLIAASIAGQTWPPGKLVDANWSQLTFRGRNEGMQSVYINNTRNPRGNKDVSDWLEKIGY